MPGLSLERRELVFAVYPDDLPELRRAIEAHLLRHTTSLRHEYRIRNRVGAYIWVRVRAVAEVVAPGQHRLAGSQSDISSRRAAVEELRHAARHDPLIVAVGDWVLRQACRQVRAWQRAGQARLRCSANLSIRQLQRSDFAALVAGVLEDSGLAATDLILEITESQLMQDTAQILASLRELAELGVRPALDDFGTGFSSLGCHKRFPLHILNVGQALHQRHSRGPGVAGHQPSDHRLGRPPRPAAGCRRRGNRGAP